MVLKWNVLYRIKRFDWRNCGDLVLEKKETDPQNFFRSYNLENIGGSIVVAADFQSKILIRPKESDDHQQEEFSFSKEFNWYDEHKEK